MIANYLKSFFTFSKKELNGLLVFCVLLVAIIVMPLVYRAVYTPEVFSFTDFKKDIESFRASEQAQPRYSYHNLKEEVEAKEFEPQYFEFNPNNLSAEYWQRLGLSKKQINTIKNYEAKGGRFYRKEDLKKIYSISKENYLKLEPYIKIPEIPRRENNYAASPVEKPLKVATIIELNAADSAKLETIRGIGPAFASRIVKYRKRLGGFYRKEQLKEVYGIDSAKFSQLENQISVDQSDIQRININTAAFDDLKQHPYLSYKQMNAIIQYRKQHGPYNTVNDLKKVLLLNEEILNKIKPYLIF